MLPKNTIPESDSQLKNAKKADLPPLKILLTAPRGFCAGVDRAIQIVELALKKYGTPVYVRHEIVHNRYVVDCLKTKGAVFIEELDEITDNNAPVIFSAHGVAKSVPRFADKRNIFYLDATCPLVSKVHREAERHHKNGEEIVLIGHAGHPEVIGTMGQLPDTKIHLIETLEDAKALHPNTPDKLAYITQTTLSVDDTKDMIAVLKQRFPNLKGPNKEDICYATTNRQMAVKAIASDCDALIVVGAPNSSNSKRLVEVAARSGCPKAILLERAKDIHWPDFDNIQTVGLTAGASAPQILVDEIIEAFTGRFNVAVESVTTASENISFKLPAALREEEH